MGSASDSSSNGEEKSRSVVVYNGEASDASVDGRESLRRELDRVNAVSLLDEREDLSAWPRNDLEHEVMRLRVLVNHTALENQRRAHFLRDLLSHQTMGKDEEYLAINSTVEDKEGKVVEASKVGEIPLSEILGNAGRRALGGGLAGAAAMVVQVVTLMPMRSMMNYQYRHGTTTSLAARKLYADGGLARFYRGIAPALLQGPLSRFGDTAANAGMLALLDHSDSTRNLPVLVKTMFASGAAAAWRMVLMPIDATKTSLQVEGSKGIPLLREKIARGGVGVLWHGAGASAAATFVGHLPWFGTFNFLQEKVPQVAPDAGLAMKLGRNAAIGFVSSVVSDSCSNSLRVIKTTRQTFHEPISYPNVVKLIVKEEGVAGLMGRGLKTRILANGIQGLLFSVIWKALSP